MADDELVITVGARTPEFALLAAAPTVRLSPAKPSMTTRAVDEELTVGILAEAT